MLDSIAVNASKAGISLADGLGLHSVETKFGANPNIILAKVTPEMTVGAGTEPFYLVFGEHYFFDGEVIFGNLNQVYPMRVLGDAKTEGTNVLYKVELN